MMVLQAALALVLAQDVPSPVRVPGHVDARTADLTTLCDGFDAYERLVAAFASADDAVQHDPEVHARADRALSDWQRRERRAAVEGWTRLALELEGATGDADLLAAVLRLECVENGAVTRIRRGFYSDGMWTRTTQLRVRALFPVPELASRSFGDEVGLVELVDLLMPKGALTPETGVPFPLEFDAVGRFERIIVDMEVGPMGWYSCDVQLAVSGRTFDRIRIHNGATDAVSRRYSLLEQASALGSASHDDAAPTARRAFASRIALVVDAASLERSSEFLFGCAERVVAREPRARWESRRVTSLEEQQLFVFEARALRDGRSPYADRAWTTKIGPYWRTHTHGNRDVPAWTLIPKAGGDSALPVIIALHEVGFDEGWAVGLAGGGALFEEADQRGFAVLAPPNAELEADPATFTALIDSLSADVRVDRTRIHVFAPASAAPLARRIAELHPALVASVVVLSEVADPDGVPSAGFGRVLGLERPIARALDGIQGAEPK
jgi:hypothetical protein